MTLYSANSDSQIVNYIANGGFEDKYTCSNQYLVNAINWDELDSGWAAKYNHYCFGSVPYNGFGFQYPRSGQAYILVNHLCLNCPPQIKRTYARNKLRRALENNKIYCVKFYVNITNNSTCGIDGFGAYFGDNTLDTIQQGHKILSYLTPQIQNPNNNVITDTLGWTLITGTFVASGSERYMVIGNFKTDANTNTISISPSYTLQVGTDVCIDDVSCIPIDLPAFAGNDTSCIPGTTVYLGRTRDVGIDEACTWYQYPNMSVPIATAVAGLTVSPVQTTTYVVRQDICGSIKWDTVVVYKDGVGFAELKVESLKFKVWPNPAGDVMQLELAELRWQIAIKKIQILNALGQLIREEEVEFKNNFVTIQTKDLTNGVYVLRLKASGSTMISKKFVISK